LLQKNHLAPTAKVIADSNKCQEHTEKLVSLDQKNGEKNKLPV
jgi:hypothetical protein